MKVIGGDFGRNKAAIMKTSFWSGRFKSILIRRSFRRDKLTRKNITSIEVVNDSNKANIVGAIGGGVVGTLLAGPVGLLAGSLLGGRGKKYIVLIQDRRQRKLLGAVNQRELELLLSFMPSSISSAKMGV